MVTEFDSSAVNNNSYLGAITGANLYGPESKEPKAQLSLRSSSNHNGPQNHCNTSLVQANSMNAASSSRMRTNNTSFLKPQLIRSADGRIFRPVAMFKAMDYRGYDEPATTFGAGVPTTPNGYLSLREIDLQLS